MKLMTIIVLSSGLLTACGVVPRYENFAVEIPGAKSIPKEQARAICVPRAKLVADRARDATAAQVKADQGRVTGYNCNTSSYGGGQSNTNCTPQTASGGFAAGWEAGEAPHRASREAGSAALASCLAEHGWRLERRCVENCR